MGRVGDRGAADPGAREARGEPDDGRAGDPVARLLRPERADAGARGDRALPRPARGGHGDRKPEALLEAALSHLEAMRGNVEESRALYRKSRAMLEELGWTFLAAQTSFDSGPVEMLAGDLATAEAELRRDYDTLERMGETNYISTTAALLAEVLYRQGDLEGAEEHTRISEELAAQDDVSSQFRWRGVRAKILATRGHAAEARSSPGKPSR